MDITLIAGARPNFMKVAPIIKAIKAFNEGLQVTGDGLRETSLTIRMISSVASRLWRMTGKSNSRARSSW